MREKRLFKTKGGGSMFLHQKKKKKRKTEKNTKGTRNIDIETHLSATQ